jgi:hypothetical protein
MLKQRLEKVLCRPSAALDPLLLARVRALALALLSTAAILAF